MRRSDSSEDEEDVVSCRLSREDRRRSSRRPRNRPIPPSKKSRNNGFNKGRAGNSRGKKHNHEPTPEEGCPHGNRYKSEFLTDPRMFELEISRSKGTSHCFNKVLITNEFDDPEQGKNLEQVFGEDLQDGHGQPFNDLKDSEIELASGQHYVGVKSNSTGSSLGLYARQDIPCNTKVATYTGRVYEKKEWSRKFPTADGSYVVGFTAKLAGQEKEVDFFVDAAHEGNHSRYANHSCNPNTVMFWAPYKGQPVFYLEAIGNIKEGDEITWFYSWKTKKKAVLEEECKCGNLNCTKLLYYSDREGVEKEFPYGIDGSARPKPDGFVLARHKE